MIFWKVGYWNVIEHYIADLNVQFERAQPTMKGTVTDRRF